MITVVCVRTGTKYPFDYVTRLHSMARRHLPMLFDFVCLTDQPQQYHPGVHFINIAAFGLAGWWAKMILFNRHLMPGGRLLYFDLDMVIGGDLTPLAEWDGEFGICRNFIKEQGHKNWPCNYGSCVMSLGPGAGQQIWDTFKKERDWYIKQCPRGDQQAIEKIYPIATYLQDVLPKGYFAHYRTLGSSPPEGAAVIAFGGSSTPANCKYDWIKEAWR